MAWHGHHGEPASSEAGSFVNCAVPLDSAVESRSSGGLRRWPVEAPVGGRGRQGEPSVPVGMAERALGGRDGTGRSRGAGGAACLRLAYRAVDRGQAHTGRCPPRLDRIRSTAGRSCAIRAPE